MFFIESTFALFYKNTLLVSFMKSKVSPNLISLSNLL